MGLSGGGGATGASSPVLSMYVAPVQGEQATTAAAKITLTPTLGQAALQHVGKIKL